MYRGHAAAAGNRADPRYGGNCTPDEYDELEKNKNQNVVRRINLVSVSVTWITACSTKEWCSLGVALKREKKLWINALLVEIMDI